jgi:hypothetical protein
MSALYENVSALFIFQRSMKKLALHENVNALLKCRHSLKKSASYESVGAILKCRHSMKKSAPYTTRHEKYTTTVQVDHLTVWPGKIHSDCSPLLLLVVLVQS